MEVDTAVSVEQVELSSQLKAGQAYLETLRQRDGVQVATSAPRTPPPTAASPLSVRDTVRYDPDLGLAVLRAGETTLYRVWLICQALDPDGRGWLLLPDVRGYVCGGRPPLLTWKRLGGLLREGHLRYWSYEAISLRIWLYAAEKLAANLGLERLDSRPIELPVTLLGESIGVFRANLQAGWHSGRPSDNPISQATLTELTGASSRTLRRYNQAAGLKVGRNLVLEPFSEDAWQEAAYRHGSAVFVFTDYHGRRGPKGERYIARHIGNSYNKPHPAAPSGRRRKRNKVLKVLVDKRERGNSSGRIARRYHANGAAAGAAYNRRPEQDAAYPAGRAKNFHVWLLLPASPTPGTRPSFFSAERGKFLSAVNRVILKTAKNFKNGQKFPFHPQPPSQPVDNFPIQEGKP